MIAHGLSLEGYCSFLMGDVLPHETENTVYICLIAISKLRLGILTEQGEGSGTLAQNETPFGLPPASILGRSNVDNAQRYVSLLWPWLRDDYACYIHMGTPSTLRRQSNCWNKGD